MGPLALEVAAAGQRLAFPATHRPGEAQRKRERRLDFSCQQHPLGSFPGEQGLRSSGRVPGKTERGLLVPVHSEACAWHAHPDHSPTCAQPSCRNACGVCGHSSARPVRLCGLSVADYKHPTCMPTCAWTPLSVRVPRVSGRICQGLHGRSFRREAQFWNISPAHRAPYY